MSAADVARLEREAAAMAPQVREIVAALETVAGGGSPRFLVAQILERSGYVTRNPARHGYDHTADVDTGAGIVARCRCGWQSTPRTAAADPADGAMYDGDLWACAEVDEHAAAENVGVPVYVFTVTGERFARQARRFGVPRGAR